MMSFGSDDVRNIELAVVAGFTAVTTLVTAYGKWSQRRRDDIKAEFDKAVAAKVQEVANAAQGVKSDLAHSTTQTTKAICEVKDELQVAHSQIDKVHTIVNSEKTSSMEELRSSRLLTLTAFRALLSANPGSADLKQAVSAAQALYNKINKETVNKIALDDSMKQESSG